MKIGAEKRRTVAVALVLLGVGVFLFVRMMFTWHAAPSVSAASVNTASASAAAETPRTGAAARRRRGARTPVLPDLDPRLRLNLLAQSEDVKYEGTARNIFDRESLPEIPQPVAPAKKETPPPPPVYVPPPPPPINLKFFGFASSPGETKKIFLAQGEDVFIASEGEIVNRRYKVVHIGTTSVEIEDVLSNNRQTIPLTPQG